MKILLHTQFTIEKKGVSGNFENYFTQYFFTTVNFQGTSTKYDPVTTRRNEYWWFNARSNLSLPCCCLQPTRPWIVLRGAKSINTTRRTRSQLPTPHSSTCNEPNVHSRQLEISRSHQRRYSPLQSLLHGQRNSNGTQHRYNQSKL